MEPGGAQSRITKKFPLPSMFRPPLPHAPPQTAHLAPSLAPERIEATGDHLERGFGVFRACFYVENDVVLSQNKKKSEAHISMAFQPFMLVQKNAQHSN